MREKSLDQLMFLSKNPYYVMTEKEKKRLDDFLSKKSESDSKKSQKKNSKKQDEQSRVAVRNVVEKADTYAPDERERTDS